VKEQDITVGDVRENISKFTLALGKTVSHMRMSIKEDTSWLTDAGAGRRNESASQDGEQKVYTNPLSDGLRKKEDARAESNKRSLMKRSSVARRRARGGTMEAEAERVRSGTLLGETTAAKIQRGKIKRVVQQRRKKRGGSRGGGGGLGAGDGAIMIEMPSLKGQEIKIEKGNQGSHSITESIVVLLELISGDMSCLCLLLLLLSTTK
jgi:hypothetical protein